ncbi:MAG: hypothetical protein OXI22_12130 [Defluviicoccus sp.]|nr:hypothetical protein [Defluviicoccus sp.]MDE0384625.1 hypothetical protein [Defluviicoccus sp.]
MAVYSVLPLGGNDGLHRHPERVAEDGYVETAPKLYLLQYDGSASSMSSKLGLGEKCGGGNALVLRVRAHAGYAYRSLRDRIEAARG